MENMFDGASAFYGNFTNCRYDDSDNVCTRTYEASDGMYDGPPGAWQRHKCVASVAPENGDVGNCTVLLDSGDTCQPTCDDGFAVTGPETCDTGVLSPALCLDTTGPACDASAAPENGGVGDCTATIASGSICQPTCDTAFAVSSFSYCDGGEYTAATCSILPTSCEISPPLNGAAGNFPSVLITGASCQPTCNAGYVGAYQHTSCLLGVITPTTCSAGSCAESERVDSNVYVACPLGMQRPAGDNVSGEGTSCSMPPPPSPPPRLVFTDYDSPAARLGCNAATRLLVFAAAVELIVWREYF